MGGRNSVSYLFIVCSGQQRVVSDRWAGDRRARGHEEIPPFGQNDKTGRGCDSESVRSGNPVYDGNRFGIRSGSQVVGAMPWALDRHPAMHYRPRNRGSITSCNSSPSRLIARINPASASAGKSMVQGANSI